MSGWLGVSPGPGLQKPLLGGLEKSSVLVALAAVCLLYSRMSISQIRFGRNLVLSPSPDLSNLGAEAELPQA